MKKILSVVLACAILLTLSIAFAEGETVIIGNTSVIDAVTPTTGGNPWSLTADGISESFYMQDAEGNLYSNIVDSLEKTDALTWVMTLKDGVKFSDGTDVNAQAVVDCLNQIMAEQSNALASCGMITPTVIDEKTVQLVTERETPVMQSVLCEWAFILFKNNGDETYVFTGPYVISEMDPGVSLTLTPNQYYDDEVASRPTVIIKKFADATAMQQAFEGGEIDMAFTVTPATAEILEGEGYTVKDIDAGYQYFAMVNMKNAALSDLNVRKAIDLALNREDMITALKGGRVATGFFATYYDFAGDVEKTYDPEQAAALLTEAGYSDSDADGILDKDGEKLSVSMVTYASRPDLTIIMQLAASELNDLGIEVTTQVLDSGIDTYLAEGDWDIAFYAQHTVPSGEPANALNMFFRTDGSKNHMGYSNADVDAMLDEMGTTEPGDARNQLAKNIQAQVNEDLPVLYLVDPQWHVAVSDALADYTPYCGDYYVVNSQLMIG